MYTLHNFPKRNSREMAVRGGREARDLQAVTNSYLNQKGAYKFL